MSFMSAVQSFGFLYNVLICMCDIEKYQRKCVPLWAPKEQPLSDEAVLYNIQSQMLSIDGLQKERNISSQNMAHVVVQEE